MVEVEYAKALFELAEEQTKTDCMDQLSLIAQILDEEPEFTKLLKSPFLSVKEKTEMIKLVFPFLNPLLKEWMILLIKRDRMDLFCRIKDSYQQLYETSFKILKIKVVSPKILDERQQEQLKQRLKQKYPDRKLEIENTIDPSLLGGIQIFANDERLDCSLKNQLAKLKRIAIRKDE